MDSQYLYNNQSTMQKEINAKYQIASKELQNLYKRSTMIEPLLQILEDIYSKVDEGAAIAPLSLSINQIKSLNADIKTCLLNVKEKKSGPFQRIIKNKGENIEALESKMDKLIKDLEVALNNAEEAAKKSSEKKRQQKASSNNNNKYNEQAQPTKYSLTDNYPQDYYNTTENYSNNYSYNNNAANDYSYQETNNYNNNNNNNNTGLDASLANQFSYLNVNDGNNAGNNNNAQVNDNAKYNYDNNTNTNQQAQPQISVQPPDYQESQETYNSYPQDTSGQFYNTYSNPSQQYYYGTLTKPDQQQQQQQQQMNNYNQYQQQNPQMMYNDPNQLQMQQMQMQQMQMQQMQMQQQMQQQQMQQQQMQQQQMQQQQMQQQQMQQQQMQQQQMQQMQQISPSQISSSEATTMDGDSSINQKGLIPPTQYFAISSFTPRQPDELAIEQGDEVIIVQTFDDGWAFGRNSRTRMVGVLPMTFLSINNQFNNYQYSNELPDRQSSRRL